MASAANQHLQAKGVKITGYDIFGPPEALVEQLRGTAVLISCITWAHLEQQLLWIRAAKAAGVQRFVPSEWVGPAPRGVIDIKDRKLDILAAIQRAHLPYTVIAAGCWFQVWVPRVPSGRSDHARSLFIDHRIVGDGTVRFALMDMMDIGRYVARIVADPRTINRCVLAYTEVLSMNEIWDVMANASGEEPLRDYVRKSHVVQHRPYSL